MEDSQGIKLKEDPVAVTILERYAIWHPEVKAEKLCSPCEHCSGGEDCHPCGASE